MARRARGREAIPKVLWESRLVMRATAGIDALPAFTGMAKGPRMVPYLMEDGEIRPAWRARCGDVGCQSWAGSQASLFPPPGYTEVADVLKS